MKTTTSHTEQVAIRLAQDADRTALVSLAQLDSAAPLVGPVLLAEAGGDVRAALSLDDGRIVADPFFPTDRLVVLLEVHAAQISQRTWDSNHRRRSAARAAGAVLRALKAREQATPQAWLRTS